MGVDTSFFGVTKLTGEDSKKFRRQVTYGRPNKQAVQTLARGERLLKAAGGRLLAVKIKSRARPK